MSFLNSFPLAGFLRPARVQPLYLLRLFLIASILFFLSGCESSHPPLKVGTNIWPGYESLYLARYKGFIDKQQISLVEKVNATQVLRAFKAQQLDVAALTMDEALTLMAGDEEGQRNLRIIAVMDFSRGADVLIAKPDISSLQSLRGKTVLAEKTAVGAIMLQSVLDKADLKSQDINVHNAPVNQHIGMWQRDDVAAVVTFEPFKSLLEDRGGHVLFDSSDVPNRIMDVLVVTEQTVRERPEQLQHLIDGHFKALAYMGAHRSESARIISQRLKVAPEKVWQSFDGLHIPSLDENRLLLGQRSLRPHIQKLSYLMYESGLIPTLPDIQDAFLEDQFLPERGQ